MARILSPSQEFSNYNYLHQAAKSHALRLVAAGVHHTGNGALVAEIYVSDAGASGGVAVFTDVVADGEVTLHLVDVSGEVFLYRLRFTG